MRNIKINENGDIVFDVLGKMKFVTDNDLIIQSLNLRIKTPRGSLFYDDIYGHPQLKGKITKESITVFLQDTLSGDERVYDVEVIDFKRQGANLYVDAMIYLNSGEVIEGSLVI